MDVKSLNCPSCGGTFNAPFGTRSLYCPYCGTMINITYEPSEQKQAEGVRFTDNKTGIPLGTAVIPNGWSTSGTYAETRIDEITPFGTAVSSKSPDGTMAFSSRSGDHWYHFVLNGPLQLGFPRKQWKKYMDPKDYLLELGRQLVNTAITPVSYGPLDTQYNRNRNEEAAKLISRFEENAHIQLPNISCEMRLNNILCESMAMIGHYQQNGTVRTILVGADLFGLEEYDAAVIGVLNRKMTKGLQSVIGIGKKKNADPAMLGAFGHGWEEGDEVDLVDWGSRRVYFATGPVEKEKEITQYFLTFAQTWKQDPALDQRLEQYHWQVRQQEQSQLQSVANYAIQSQQINAQRQREISRTLSETSDIIMQGYNNRMASQDRISKNWTEAILGVNSYETTDGRTVQHSVVSDHVYQTNTGDTVGVSGTLPEVPQDWTELQKKD